jgi:hypothetical protein
MCGWKESQLSQKNMKAKKKKTYISVCKNVILSNLKHGTNKAPIRVCHGKHGRPYNVHELALRVPTRIVYSNPKDPNAPKPMPWGARVWIETLHAY